MATLENSYKNCWHYFNFRAIVYLFGRCAAELKPLSMANLNNGKIHRKEYLRVIVQLGMRSLSFLRNDLKCTQIAMTVF